MPSLYVNMTDINSDPHRERAAKTIRQGKARELDDGRGAKSDDTLISLVELLFFAYRDFTGEADTMLAELDFGRAHHRVLHFVNRRPGMRVADLLDILRITKQSLARVLKQLVDRGFIAQEAGAEDRRERRLHLTAQGQELAARLSKLQTARIRQALDLAGPSGEEIARAFLLGIVGPEHRENLDAALRSDDAISPPLSIPRHGKDLP